MGQRMFTAEVPYACDPSNEQRCLNALSCITHIIIMYITRRPTHLPRLTVPEGALWLPRCAAVRRREQLEGPPGYFPFPCTLKAALNQ